MSHTQARKLDAQAKNIVELRAEKARLTAQVLVVRKDSVETDGTQGEVMHTLEDEGVRGDLRKLRPGSLERAVYKVNSCLWRGI